MSAADEITSEMGQAADRAAAEAKAAGATGGAHRGDLTRHEKQLRDTAIITAAHAGRESKVIAKEWGLTRRSVDRILASFHATPSPLEQRPMELVEELLRLYRMQIDGFASTMAANAARNPNVSLGAQKGLMESIDKYVGLLADIGKLPSNLELFRSEAQMLRIGEQMVDEIRALLEGAITAEELADAFARLLEGFRGHSVIESTAVELGPAAPSGR